MNRKSSSLTGVRPPSLSRRNLLSSLGSLGLLASARPLMGLLISRNESGRTRRGSPKPERRLPEPTSPGMTFVDVTSKAGLAGAENTFGGVDTKNYLVEETGCGAAFFDYDHDGWLDIFLVNGTTFEGAAANKAPRSYLFHNNCNGTFTDVSAKAGLVRTGWGQGCCVGDYDSDGFDDLFVTYWGQNVLYRNNGDGTFMDVTEKAGLLQAGPVPRWNTGACFLDYDLDGNLDLFVANYVTFDPNKAPAHGANQYCLYHGIPTACGPQGLGGGTNILYRNRGDGTFEDVSEKSGVANQPRGVRTLLSVTQSWRPIGSYGFTVVAADFDNDGWPDIYVACDTAPSRLYHNNHDGTFTEMGIEAGCAFNEDGQGQAGMGVAVGDYDDDGWLDIVKTNFADETTNLYRNNGNGTFHDVVFQAGLGMNTKYLGWGVGLEDFDNDGWKDIFIANGHVFPEVSQRKLHVTYKERKIVYRNLGNGRFGDVTAKCGSSVMEPRPSRGCAFGDFDNDGDVDVLVNNINEPPSLLRNDGGNRNNWVKIKCIGTRSNRSAIGTRVRVVTGQHSQIEEVMSGGSYVSQNDLRLHFGLGRAKKVDLIELRWPSGLKESFRDVTVNLLVVFHEGQGISRREKFRA
jgi:enediyne biosynthesis protein E4